MTDLETAIRQLYQLNDEQLADFSAGLDHDIVEARSGDPIGFDEDLTALAGAARILLRRRRATAARDRAHQKVSALRRTMGAVA